MEHGWRWFAYWLAVAASFGWWANESTRHHMLHAPIRVAHGRKIR